MSGLNRESNLAWTLLHKGRILLSAQDIWGRPMRTKWLATGSVVILLLLALESKGWSENQQLSFGVIIWRSPTLTAQFWNPILRYVSDKSRVSLHLKVAPTGPE